MVLGDPLGRYALGQFNEYAVAGELAAFEDADDAASFVGRVVNKAVLATTEDEDTAYFKIYPWPLEMCKPRSVCHTGATARDPSCIVLNLINPVTLTVSVTTEVDIVDDDVKKSGTG